MRSYRTFNADRFLDKFQGQESLLRAYATLWNGRLASPSATLDVPGFREMLSRGGEAQNELLEEFYRAYDLCTERGHEDLLAACRDMDYTPDPDGQLPVECLSLKVRTENEEAFNLAYDRYALSQAERFAIYRGKEPRCIGDIAAAAAQLQDRLARRFKEDKHSDRVLVRYYEDDPWTHLVIYHEKRTKAELVFKGTHSRPTISPTIFRPAQQDFLSYNCETGQLEIEARCAHEAAVLRREFADCCFGEVDFFEGARAAERFNLARITEQDFDTPVDDGDSAVLRELHFSLAQRHVPSFTVRSKDTLDTLELAYLRTKLAGGAICKAVFKITFPDDRRGKRIEVSCPNTIKFKRTTHTEDVYRYLTRWGLITD